MVLIYNQPMDKTTLERMDLPALEAALAKARLSRIKQRLMGRARAAIEQTIPYAAAAALFCLFGLIVFACSQSNLISTHPTLCMALCLAGFIGALAGCAILINRADMRRRRGWSRAGRSANSEMEFELGFEILSIEDEIKKRGAERTMLMEQKELKAASRAGRSGPASKRI